jgi:archaellum component FlaF (FlaF/FlaG flagellin family)
MKTQFGTILVEIILFIVAGIAAYIFVSTAYNNLNGISNAAIANSQSLQNQLNTYITLDSCAYNNTTDLLYFYVTNRGSIVLNQNLTLLFINGVLVNNTITHIANSYTGTSAWGPYDTIVIVANISVTTNFYQVKIVASTGAYTQNLVYVNRTVGTCTVV